MRTNDLMIFLMILLLTERGKIILKALESSKKQSIRERNECKNFSNIVETKNKQKLERVAVQMSSVFKSFCSFVFLLLTSFTSTETRWSLLTSVNIKVIEFALYYSEI